MTPKQIAEQIAEAGALLRDSAERSGIIHCAAEFIRQERTRAGNLNLTRLEAEAVLRAVGQMTEANSYDFNEWRSQTSGTAAEWHALRRAERKLQTLTR